jgi:hypothetical protein
MSFTCSFPKKIEGYVEQVPMFLTPMREPDIKQADVLAKVFKINGKIEDEGEMYSIQTQNSILHQFHASDSMRWASEIHSPEHETNVLKITDPEKLLSIADKFLSSKRLSDKRASFSHIIFGQVETSRSDNAKPVPVNTCAYVNYTYSLAGLPLLGPGAKIQVVIGANGKVIECYRFWREVKEGGVTKKTLSIAAIQKLFRENPGFAQLKQDAKVVVERARMGYLTLSPSDVQGALIPVVEFCGFVSTREIEKAAFIRSMIVIDYTNEEIKRYRVYNKHYSGSCRML